MAVGPPNAGPYDPTTTPLQPLLARDVAAVQAGSYLVIRFIASHPQLWFFHCHIEWHLGERRGREKRGWWWGGERGRLRRSSASSLPLPLLFPADGLALVIQTGS